MAPRTTQKEGVGLDQPLAIDATEGAEGEHAEGGLDVLGCLALETHAKPDMGNAKWIIAQIEDGGGFSQSEPVVSAVAIARLDLRRLVLAVEGVHERHLLMPVTVARYARWRCDRG